MGVNEKNEVYERNLHMSRLWREKKVDIQRGKVDIENVLFEKAVFFEASGSRQVGLEETSMNNDKVYQMSFSKVYPLLVNKAVKKGRSKEEVNEVIRWLTGYSQEKLEESLEKPVSYGDFFRYAPELNPNRMLIKGTVCGIRVEEIEEPLMREIRYLDKLVDELAKGKSMDKILRK